MNSFKIELITKKISIPDVITQIDRYYVNSRILQHEIAFEKECRFANKIVNRLDNNRKTSLIERFGSSVEILRAYNKQANGVKTMPIGKYVILRKLISEI